MTAAVSLTEPRPPRPLTERQAIVFDFIRAYRQERGYAPSYREIMTKLGIRSTNGVADHLRALRRKGYLAEQTPEEVGRTRAVVISQDSALVGHLSNDRTLALAAENARLRALLRRAREQLLAVSASAADSIRVLADLSSELDGGEG